jgi:hypothetical protein
MEDYVLSDEDERIVEEGSEAQALLDNPMFIAVIERVRQQCADAILRSDPNQVAQREQSYNLSRGLSAITEELLIMQAAGESTLENATRPSTADDDVQADTPDFVPSEY